MEDFYPLEECNNIEVDSTTLQTKEHEKPEIKEEIKEPFLEITGWAYGLFPFYILIYLIIIVNLSLTNLSLGKNKLECT